MSQKRGRHAGARITHGRKAGWSDFRYGEQSQGKVYDPSKRRIRKALEGARRDHIIARVTEILRDWTVSRFEHEAACRHGIRQALCLDAFGWQVSDDEAASIVAECLRNLRATRPTWEQGQRDYTEPRENCARCRAPLDQEQIAHSDRYCSSHCAAGAREDGILVHGEVSAKAYYSAARIVRRAKKPVLTCQTCGNHFQQRGENNSTTAKYCSMICFHRRAVAVLAIRACEVCGTHFEAKHPRAAYCSGSCKVFGPMIRKGTWKGRFRPKVVTPLVFDYIVTAMAA